MYATMERQKPGSALTLPAWPTLDRRIDVSDGTCSVEGCNKSLECRGLCNAHYKQARGAGLSMLSIEERFWAKVNKTDECWLWTGAKLPRGYGQFHVPGYKLAHRYAYELLVGPIPDTYTIDHTCRNPSCVRPDHLEPVTMRENLLRGDTVSGVNARKTHCLRGHELSGANLMMYGEYRQCRTCRNDGQNRRYRERRQSTA